MTDFTHMKQRIPIITIVIPIDPFMASKNFYHIFPKNKNIPLYRYLTTSGILPINCMYLIPKALKKITQTENKYLASVISVIFQMSSNA